MRTAVLIAVASILGIACYPTETRTYPTVRHETSPQVFEAWLTNGVPVSVREDRRTGDLFIVEPEQLRGEPVAIVNRDDHGRMIVTRDFQRRYYREGSGGDADDWRREHRDDRR